MDFDYEEDLAYEYYRESLVGDDEDLITEDEFRDAVELELAWRE